MTTLRIQKQVYDAIIEHATRDKPNEACGYLAGDDGLVTLSVPLRNADGSPEHYSFDPAEQFAAVRDIRAKKQKPLAVYHSHPATPSRMSQEDIRLAYDPNLSWVIVSLAGETPVAKSFRVNNGISEEEELMIV